MSTLLLLSLALPVALLVLLVLPGAPRPEASQADPSRTDAPERGALRHLALRLAPWSPLPALLVALRPGGVETVTFPWLLEGSRWGLDVAGQVFLFFTALLWLLAGIYASRYLARDPLRRRFFVFHLLTLTGNLGLCAAQDLIGFYLCFALMTFAGYGLVVHARTDDAFRAGRIYLAMAVLGETLLISALIMAGSTAESLVLHDVASAVAQSPYRGAIIGLLLAGFGVKAGALPLHVWLPLAHPVAPTPASAVLSGSMIKAGLLGWLRFLPLGAVALPGWGSLLIALGLAAAFFGVVVGVTQRDAKTALAYSSISQMGLLNVAVGIALSNAAGAASAVAACLAYAVHHGLAKGALFLGVGVVASAGGDRERRLVLAGLVFAALAVAGAPLTSGAVAKDYLKDVAELSPTLWPGVLEWLLPLTAVGTTLLMARFLVLASRERPEDAGRRVARGVWVPWAVLLGGVAGVVWGLPLRYELELKPPGLPYPDSIWMSIWPIVAGLLLSWSVLFAARTKRVVPGRFHIVPGDILLAGEWVLARIRRSRKPEPSTESRDPMVSLGARWYGIYAASGRGDRALRMEIALTGWTVAILLFALVFAVLLALLATGAGGGP
jgi:formate hydrogenlyase subunit 3/multisubunit Na+/H+ antiporter MnhD subunit